MLAEKFLRVSRPSTICVFLFFCTQVASEKVEKAKGKQGKAEPITKTLPGMAGFFGLLE